MIPTNNFFINGGPGETVASTAAMLLMLLAILGMFMVPRRLKVVPLLFGVLFIPIGNVFVLGGLHLTPVRVLVLAGWAILCVTGGVKRRVPLTGIDKAVLGWTIATAIAVTLQWMNVPAIVNQAGIIVNTVGSYFLLRQLVVTEEDAGLAVQVLIVVSAINAVGMMYELAATQNLFGIYFGGVQSTPLVRMGRTRAQGVFQHAILAGAYGATLLPLCFWLWTSRRARFMAVLGAITGTVMTLLSASSTPVMAYTGWMVAICLWPLRRNLQMIRRTLACVLLGLHLVMKAPVWFLIARIDVIGGSASFDRAYLIDTCVRHFSDWWLMGTHDTGSWGWSMWDLSNQFVSVAETGGLAALVFFILIIVRCFSQIGNARKALVGNMRGQWSLWFIGAALYAHVLAYFGVSYFDQTQVSWFVLLAMIPVVTAVAVPEQPLATESPVAKGFLPRTHANAGLVNVRAWRTP
jgi:hypothetical protein